MPFGQINPADLCDHRITDLHGQGQILGQDVAVGRGQGDFDRLLTQGSGGYRNLDHLRALYIERHIVRHLPKDQTRRCHAEPHPPRRAGGMNNL